MFAVFEKQQKGNCSVHALSTLGSVSILLIWGRSAFPFRGFRMKASALILRVPPGLGICWEVFPCKAGGCGGCALSGGDVEGGEGTGEAFGVG